ncbi:Uncharacterised protein [Mycobacteroides abscessus subsp. abscessus]|nr:Uncharacterised protein [Mycobacteroides abscessus subsp. abscessus]
MLMQHSDEQVLGTYVRVVFGEPALLFGDDVDHGLFDQDRGVDALDFGLLVTQPGHECLVVRIRWPIHSGNG